MRNYPEIYIVIVNLDLGDGYAFPTVQCFCRTKKHAKQFLKFSPFGGEIRKIDPTDYALVIRKGIGEPEMISATGSRFYREMEEAKQHYTAIYPDFLFSVVKFDETELYKKIIIDIDRENEQQGVMYA
ncbi:TPA: hypothetical protein ACU18R_002471 [Mannheimia haemolytica]